MMMMMIIIILLLLNTDAGRDADLDPGYLRWYVLVVTGYVLLSYAAAKTARWILAA